MIESQSAPGRDWLEIISRPGMESFARAFSPAPVLEASAAEAPLFGVEAIRKFFAITRRMYERIGFVYEVRGEKRIFLEWEGVFQGRAISGATILSCNADGAI